VRSHNSIVLWHKSGARSPCATVPPGVLELVLNQYCYRINNNYSAHHSNTNHFSRQRSSICCCLSSSRPTSTSLHTARQLAASTPETMVGRIFFSDRQESLARQPRLKAQEIIVPGPSLVLAHTNRTPATVGLMANGTKLAGRRF